MQHISQLLPTFIAIPASVFAMGTPERSLSALAQAYGGTRESYREEAPQHTLALPAFAIARTPVTNALYAAYVAASGARLPIHWHGAQPPAALLAHPLVDVSWDEAQTFCAWLTVEMKNAEMRMQNERASAALPNSQFFILNSAFSIRLPTEAEWERAARGTDGRTFPWGEQWDAALANTREAALGRTTPVGAYPLGTSPAGCLDMAGNVWEWTASLDAGYPYRPDDGRNDPYAPGRRILRGGCYANPHGFARCACRFRLQPNVHNEFLGLRLAY